MAVFVDDFGDVPVIAFFNPIDEIKELIENVLEGIRAKIDGILSRIRSFIGGLVGSIAAVVSTIAVRISDSLLSGLETALEPVRQAVGAVTNVLRFAVDRMAGIVESLKAAFLANMAVLGNTLSNTVAGALEVVTEPFRRATATLASTVLTLRQLLFTGFERVIDSIVTQFKAIVGGIKDAFTSLIDAWTRGFDALIAAWLEGAQVIIDAILQAFSVPAGAMEQAIDFAFDQYKDKIQSIGMKFAGG